MSAALDLLREVEVAGGTVATVGGRLKVRAPAPLPDALVDQLRRRKPELLHILTPPAKTLGCPLDWVAGVGHLAKMEPPLDWPARRWRLLVDDACQFLERWAGQAHRLGWHSWELWGCHRRAPWGAIHGQGLVLLLGGHELVAMTAGETVVRITRGRCQTYRRKLRDPLHPAERSLIWELGE